MTKTNRTAITPRLPVAIASVDHTGHYRFVAGRDSRFLVERFGVPASLYLDF